MDAKDVEELTHYRKLRNSYAIDELDFCLYCNWLLVKEQSYLCQRCERWLCYREGCGEYLSKCTRCGRHICYECCTADDDSSVGVRCNECET